VDQLAVDQLVEDQWPIVGIKNLLRHHSGWLSLGSGRHSGPKRSAGSDQPSPRPGVSLALAFNHQLTCR
jgi:hypothetical protein